MRFLYILLILFLHQTISVREENFSKRLTHAFINGEVRGNGTLPIEDKNGHLLIEARLIRDDRSRSIARTKIKLYINSTIHSFNLQFKLKYPLSKISPHNKYVISARIQNGLNKLLYIGDLPVPVTEHKEKQVKFLIIPVIPTRKFEDFFIMNYLMNLFSSIMVS